MATFDLSNLEPIDDGKKKPLDLTGLEPLDVSGLQPIEDGTFIPPDANVGALIEEGTLPGYSGSAVGGPSKAPAVPTNPNIKPFFSAIGNSFARSWYGETQADLVGELGDLVAERARIEALPPGSKVGESPFAPTREGVLKWSDKALRAKSDELKAVTEKLNEYQGVTEGMSNFQSAKGVEESLSALVSSPLDVIAQGFAESSVPTGKAIGAGVGATGAVVGSGGAAIPAMLTGLAASGVVTGVDSKDGQLLQNLVQWGERNGVDVLQNPAAFVQFAKQNPEVFARDYSAAELDAIKTGVAEGGLTAVLGGVSKVIPGASSTIGKLASGLAKGSTEEVLTTAGTAAFTGKKQDPKELILSGFIGGPMDAVGDVLTDRASKPPAGPAPAAGQAPGPAPAAGAAPAPAAGQAPGPAPAAGAAPAPAAGQAPGPAPAAGAAPAPGPSQAPAGQGQAPSPVPSTTTVEPAPEYPGKDASPSEGKKWLNDFLNWKKKYGRTHWTNGNPKPANAIYGTPEYAAANPGSVEPAPDDLLSKERQEWDKKYGKTHLSDGTLRPNQQTAEAAPVAQGTTAQAPSNVDVTGLIPVDEQVDAEPAQPAPVSTSPVADVVAPETQPAEKPRVRVPGVARQAETQPTSERPVTAEPAQEPQVETVPAPVEEPEPEPAPEPVPQAPAPTPEKPRVQVQAEGRQATIPQSRADLQKDSRWKGLDENTRSKAWKRAGQLENQLRTRAELERTGKSTKSINGMIEKTNAALNTLLTNEPVPAPAPKPVAQPAQAKPVAPAPAPVAPTPTATAPTPAPAPMPAQATAPAPAPRPAPARTAPKPLPVQPAQAPQPAPAQAASAPAPAQSAPATPARLQAKDHSKNTSAEDSKLTAEIIAQEKGPISKSIEQLRKLDKKKDAKSKEQAARIRTQIDTWNKVSMEIMKGVKEREMARNKAAEDAKPKPAPAKQAPAPAQEQAPTPAKQASTTAPTEPAQAPVSEAKPADTKTQEAVKEAKDFHDSNASELEDLASSGTQQADKDINGKKGLLSRVKALFADLESGKISSDEAATEAREIADDADSLAREQEDKASVYEDSGREDPFSDRDSYIQALEDLTSNLNDLADKLAPKADAKPASDTAGQDADLEARRKAIVKNRDLGVITQKQFDEEARKINEERRARETARQEDALKNLSEKGDALIKEGNDTLRNSTSSMGAGGIEGGSKIVLGYAYKWAAKLGEASNLPERVAAAKMFKQEFGEAVGKYFDEVYDKVKTMLGATRGETVARIDRSKQVNEGRDSTVGKRVNDLSAVELMEGDVPNFRKTGNKGKKATVKDLARYFMSRAKKATSGLKFSINDKSERARRFMKETIVDEAVYALSKAGNAIGWYDGKVREAINEVSKIHPELNLDNDSKESRTGRFIFTIATAISSNGQDVFKNFDRGEQLYAKWKESGKIETDGEFGGKNQKAINEGLTIVQKLIDDYGVDGAEKFLKTDTTVGDLRKAGFDVPGELVDTKVKAAVVLGPKIGSFFGNLNGDYDSVTMDRWFMRTINRIRGTIALPPSDETIGRRIERLVKAIKSEKGIDVATKKELIADGQRILNSIKDGTFDFWNEYDNKGVFLQFADKRLSDYTKSKFKDKTELHQASQRVAESTDIDDTPANGRDRAYLREVMADVQEELKARGIDITNADLQALLWYHEKDLYQRLGIKNKRSESADYADAARQLVRDRLGDGADGSNLAGGPGSVRDGQSVSEAPGGDNATGGSATRQKGVVTPDGDVANHNDQDLADRGFITQKALSTLPEDFVRGARLKGGFNKFGDLMFTLDDPDRNSIAGIKVTVEDGEATVDRIDVDPSARGRKLSTVLYAEVGERLRRQGVNKLNGKIIDQEQRPIAARRSAYGQESTEVVSEDNFTAKQTGDSPETHRWVESKLPAYTPAQRKLIADVKEAAKSKDESKLKAAIDRWADSVLGKPGEGRLFSPGPDTVLALTWRASKEIASGAVDFAKWSSQTVQKYGAKIKPFLKQIWADAKRLGQKPYDFATFRYLSSRADKLWQNADRNIQSPTLRRLANLIHNRQGPDAEASQTAVPQRIQMARAQFINGFSKILREFRSEFSNMDSAARRAWDTEFVKAIRGEIPMPTGKLGEAVTKYRQLMRELLNYQQRAGIPVRDWGENYFTRIWEHDLIDADKEGFVKVATEMYTRRFERLLSESLARLPGMIQARSAELKKRDVDAGRKIKTQAEYDSAASDWGVDQEAKIREQLEKTPEQNELSARQWLFRITNGTVDDISLHSDGNIEPTAPDSTDSRSFTDEEAAIGAAFMSNDIGKITSRYIGSAVKNAEIARTFGTKGEKFTQMMMNLQREGVPSETISETADLVRRSLGLTTERHSRTVSAAFDWMNLAISSGYLGFSFVNNLLLEPISFGIRTGNPYLALRAIAETWRAMAEQMSRTLPGVHDKIESQFGTRLEFSKQMSEALSEQLGLIQMEMDNVSMDAHWDYSSEEGGSPSARWLSQRVQNAILMEQSEKAKVVASVKIARLAIRDNARFMFGQAPIQRLLAKVGIDAKAPESSAIVMREIGIPDADHNKFAKWVMALDGKADSEYQAAIMDNTPEAILYRRAIQRMSLGLSVKTNPAMRMSRSDRVEGRMLMQLMNYSYAYSNMVKDRMYSMAKGVVTSGNKSVLDRARMAVPLMVGAPLAVLASEAGKQLVNELWPTEGTEKRDELSEEAKLFDSASYAGLFGPKIEFLARIVAREQIPGGPAVDALGKTIGLGGKALLSGEEGNADQRAAKQVFNIGVKPVAISAASAAHPFFGFITNQWMRQKDTRNDFIESATGRPVESE